MTVFITEIYCIVVIFLRAFYSETNRLSSAENRRVSGQRNAHQCTHSFYLFIWSAMQYTQPARKHCIRKRNKLLVQSLLAASVISHDTRFVMDFLIFVREVIWYVFIWLWLAPRGAGGYCRGCSCANITWFCLQQSLYTNPSWYCFHSWQTSGSNCSPTTLYPTVYVCTYMHLYMCVCVCVKSHVILVTTWNTSGKTIKINRK